jgi:outer membrane lipoprotein-sorting protein
VISANFSLKYTSASEKNFVNGKFVMKNNKFVIDMPEMKIYFDGKTQWTYMPKTNEVTITEPDSEESTSINPLLLIKTINSNSVKKIKDAQLPKNQIITFTPKDAGSDYEKLELTTEKSTNNPVSLFVFGKDKSKAEFQLINYKIEKNIDDKYFVFDKNNYKNVYVNDLR